MVANKAIFGGGPYSTKGSRMLRIIGKKEWVIRQIGIRAVRGGKRKEAEKKGYWSPGIHPPYMPSSFADEYHPGGNSLCYLIQTAHLMGADPIYVLAFTLKRGTGYFFGLTNPVTGQRSFYDHERALDWLEWYQKTFPNRVRLLPGWEGPIYNVFPTEALDAYKARLSGGSRPEEVRQGEGASHPEKGDTDDHGIDRSRHGEGTSPSWLW